MFAWGFLLIQWALIARSANVAGVMLAHLNWSDDHLTITTPKTKTDQKADTAFPKAVYANPFNPEICPVLALAITTFCRPFIPSGIEPQLFPGPDQEDRYVSLSVSVPSL